MLMGTTREFFQIGLSANKTGISVYILGIKDKTYLAQTYGKKLGKASVSGYCIKFKTIKEINIDILEAAIRYGVEATNFHSGQQGSGQQTVWQNWGGRTYSQQHIFAVLQLWAETFLIRLHIYIKISFLC